MVRTWPNAAMGRYAIKLKFLEQFMLKLDPELTTTEVVTQVVCPQTKNCGCRYVDILDPSNVGSPDYFISHRWGAKFSTVVNALLTHFRDAGVNTDNLCVWLDIFAVNQHPGQEQVDDLSSLQLVIKEAKQTLLIMDSSGQVLRRVWCLFEIWKTVEYHDVDGLVVVAHDVDLIGLKDIFLKLNVAEAQATVESDRLKILNDIKTTVGIEAMNQSIRRALVGSARLEVLKLKPFKEAKANAYFAALDKAGQMMTLAGMYAEAQPLMVEALELCKRLVGEMHPHTASCESNIAGLLRHQGKLADAEPHQMRALAISEKVNGDNSKTAMYLGNLAQLLQVQARHAEAEPLLVRALKITSAQAKKRGSSRAQVEDMDSAALLNSLASLYMDMDRPREALPLYKRALMAVEASLSPQDPEIAIYLANLAGVLQDLQLPDEAEELQRRAVNLCERNLGHEHPMTASCISNLAEMVGQRGRMAEAESLARDSLSIRQKVLGEEHPATSTSLNNLAGILMEQNKLAEAEPLMRKALRLAERTMGREHPMTANRLHNLASLLEEQGQTVEAAELYQAALATREKVLGRDHADTLATASCLAATYFTMGMMDDTVAMYRRVVVAQRKQVQSRGVHQQMLLTSISNLAMVLHKSGKHAEALELAEESRKLAMQQFGADSEEAQSYLQMAESLQSHLDHSEHSSRSGSKGKSKSGGALSATPTKARLANGGRGPSSSPASPSRMGRAGESLAPSKRVGSFTGGNVVQLGSGVGGRMASFTTGNGHGGGGGGGANGRARRASVGPGSSGHSGASNSPSGQLSPSSSMAMLHEPAPPPKPPPEQFFYVPDKKNLPWATAGQSKSTGSVSAGCGTPTVQSKLASVSSPLQPWTSKSSPMPRPALGRAVSANEVPAHGAYSSPKRR